MKRYIRTSTSGTARWIDRLPEDVKTRLANCTSRKSDLEYLVSAKWGKMKEQGKNEQGFTREDALIQVLELLESNGQNIDLTPDEYDDLKSGI